MVDLVSRLQHALMVSAVAATLAACHSAPVDTTPPPLEQRLGVFRFSEHISAVGTETIDIEGHFVVWGDTVTVEARPGPCRLDTRVSIPNPFTYECGNVVLTFDRQNPVGGAKYSVMLNVTQVRTVCVRYSTDSSGRRVCIEQRTDPQQPRQVKQTGFLRVTRVTS
jgi:hypothetical protein